MEKENTEQVFGNKHCGGKKSGRVEGAGCDFTCSGPQALRGGPLDLEKMDRL